MIFWQIPYFIIFLIEKSDFFFEYQIFTMPMPRMYNQFLITGNKRTCRLIPLRPLENTFYINNGSLLYSLFLCIDKVNLNCKFKHPRWEKTFVEKAREWNYNIPTQSSCLFSAWHLRQASKSKQIAILILMLRMQLLKPRHFKVK